MAFDRCALVRFRIDPEVVITAGAIEFTAVVGAVLEQVAALHDAQNSALPGVRGNGMTSRMLAMPVAY